MMSGTAPPANKKLAGLVAATFTPFNDHGEINLSVIGPYIDYLTEKQGVKNIFVNGTTGEFASLTVAERMSLAEDWCQKAKGKMDHVILHIGCSSLNDSLELARHAQRLQPDGIAAISPSFFKPATAEALRMFLHKVAAAAPDIPFYYYHLPAVTGVKILARDVLDGIETLIPTFRGIKFSSTDLLDFGRCVSLSQPQWSLLYGVDEQLLGALPLGAQGAVGSTYNYLGSHFNKLLSGYESCDLTQAKTIQFKVQDFICFAMKKRFDVGVNKQVMEQMSGLTLGPPRLPVMPCTVEHAQTIVHKLHSVFPED
ncbi:N-acetylneuraminate lyase isoform 1-T2 [Aulostomus maculatus]